MTLKSTEMDEKYTQVKGVLSTPYKWSTFLKTGFDGLKGSPERRLLRNLWKSKAVLPCVPLGRGKWWEVEEME